jgi:hypothetical protein
MVAGSRWCAEVRVDLTLDRGQLSVGITLSAPRSYYAEFYEASFPAIEIRGCRTEGFSFIQTLLLLMFVEGFNFFAILRGMGNEMDAATATCRTIRPPRY